eukprot:TRINITY_DN2948_c0_g1_i2.p1 TRINITY_DN2948_c0_g1~~TRINITY_DN2948_c0_g1_i2.p1  ORF type:complete len:103 (-),score=11.44 TRINITY_DN2948_c0_g1_i2:91-399(-)
MMRKVNISFSVFFFFQETTLSSKTNRPRHGRNRMAFSSTFLRSPSLVTREQNNHQSGPPPQDQLHLGRVLKLHSQDVENERSTSKWQGPNVEKHRLVYRPEY